MRPILPLLAALVLLLDGLASARVPRTITVRTPKVELPASSNTEFCWFVRIPTSGSFPLGSWTITHAGAKGLTLPSHGLVYLYTGERLAEFPEKTLVPSRACLELGPDDRDRRILFASGASKSTRRALPKGVAVELAPVSDAPGGAPAAIGILLDVNWSNGETRPKKVSTKLVLKQAPAKRIRRTARPLFVRGANEGLFVPPFELRSTASLIDARWTAPGDSCVLGLSGQMHRRGRCVGVDFLDATGTIANPPGSVANPCEPDRRQQLFVGVDYTDPGSLALTTPLPVGTGEALDYACWVDNGADRAPVRLGCESSPGQTPGSVGVPSPVCTLAVPASAECPGNAACVPANAVAGVTLDDELCGMTAFVYDAAPGGSCDVSSLAP